MNPCLNPNDAVTMLRTFSFATAFAMGALLSGCAVDQAAEVGEYREILKLGPAPRYVEGEPLSLADAARLTNDVNERLSIEGEAYVQALNNRRRSASSLMPTLDFFGNLTVRDRSSGSGSGGDGDNSGSSNAKTTLFDGGIGGQYSLFTGLTDFRRVDSATLTIEQRHWLLLDLRETLLLETVRAYYNVLLAERLVNVFEFSLSVQEERLRDIAGRQAAGFARPLDVAQIEAQLSETRVALLDARNAARTARSSLSFLTGVDVETAVLSDGFTPADEIPSRERLRAAAWETRQDLASTKANAAAIRAIVDAQIGRYYPTVTVNFDYFLTRDTVPTDRDWTGLLTINLPLFTAGRIDADVRDAWSQFRQAVLAHSLTRRQIQRDVDIAHADLTATRARVEETKQQLRAADEALRQAEASYKAGLGTNLERISAQDQLLTAQVRLAREEFNAKIAYLVGMRVVGKLVTAMTGEEILTENLPPVREAPESPFITLPKLP